MVLVGGNLLDSNLCVKLLAFTLYNSSSRLCAVVGKNGASRLGDLSTKPFIMSVVYGGRWRLLQG
jgi:hypothetical protein